MKPKTIKCSECDKYFIDVNGMIFHRMAIHNIAERKGYKKNWQSRLAKIQEKNKKKAVIPNLRNPLREGRAPHHFKRPYPMMEEDVKKFKENNKIVGITKIKKNDENIRTER